jgi:uncharacterized protein (TIGR00369 family)
VSALPDLAAARRLARERGDFSGLRARIPFADFLGIEAESSGARWRFRLPFRADLVGNTSLPAIHGGVIASFMESAAQLQLLISLDERRLPKSINFSIDYLRSGNPADCFVECEVMRQGRRVAQVQIRCWQPEAGRSVPAAQQREVALARAHFLLASEADV